MNRTIPPFLLTVENRSFLPGKKKHSLPFIDKTIRNVAGFIKMGYMQGETASSLGFLQKTDARIKVIFLLWFMVFISVTKSIPELIGTMLFITSLYALSRLNIWTIYKRIFLISFFFGFLVIAPATLNIVTPGKTIATIYRFQEARQWWIYHIPSEISITREGMAVVAKLYLKIVNSISLTLLIFNTTPFHHIIKGLKILRVPGIFLLIVTMTYKYIFILAHTVQETYFALKLRWWSKVNHAETKKIVAGRIVYVFHKSWQRYEDIFKAMLARGFNGQVEFCYIGKVAIGDICFLLLFVGASLLLLLT